MTISQNVQVCIYYLYRYKWMKLFCNIINLLGVNITHKTSILFTEVDIIMTYDNYFGHFYEV